MKLISSPRMGWIKYGIPLQGVLGAAVLAVPLLYLALVQGNYGFLLLLIPPFLLAGLLWKLFACALVDEVWDDETALVIRNDGKEERIDFSDISNFEYFSVRPPWIMLILERPSIFGRRIYFVPPGWAGFRQSWVAAHLQQRLEDCRRIK